MRDYDVRTPSIDVGAHALSGGNQQKLIVGREMSGNPVLVLQDVGLLLPGVADAAQAQRALSKLRDALAQNASTWELPSARNRP